jgi:hypothetical protein
VIVAPSDAIHIHFATKSHLAWTVSPCALSWHAYRGTARTLQDLDLDGLADNYGLCYQSDLTEPEVMDSSTPPPGFMHYYLVTAVNAVGESSLGYTSGGGERPNLSPCP